MDSSSPDHSLFDLIPTENTLNFSNFVNHSEFSDVLIEIDEDKSTIFAHKFILAASSSYFKNLLYGPFQESKTNRIKICFIQRDIMLKVLEYLYSCKVTQIALNDVILLCKAANMLQIHSLENLCVEFYRQKLSQLDLAGLFEQAIIFNVKPLMDMILEANASLVLKNTDLLRHMSQEILKSILLNDHLMIEEKTLLECVIQWGKVQLENSSSTDLKNFLQPLMQYIRWIDIDSQFIATQIEPLSLVDPSVLLAVYRYQLTSIKDESQNEIMYHHRTGVGKCFRYESDFDTNGVLYYLGTRRPNQQPIEASFSYDNPALIGMVQVLYSSIKPGCKAEDFIGRNKNSCMSKDEPLQYFGVRLLHYQLKPTAYTIRYGGSSGDSCMRFWNFEASINGKDWVVLKKHENDVSLDQGWATKTFPLEKVEGYFEYFRIIQTDKNKNGTRYLLNSGLELYGLLKKS